MNGFSKWFRAACALRGQNVRCGRHRIAVKLLVGQTAGDMFRQDQETVFILGAGASWHYGYPLGEDLVERVVAAAEDLGAFYQMFGTRSELRTEHVKLKSGATPTEQFATAQRDCEELKRRLSELSPPVIDYFLGHSNPPIRDVGRLLIALVILQCEANVAAMRRNHNRPLGDVNPFHEFRQKGHWCRFLNYHLTVGCQSQQDVLDNHVSFITFNYDMSLEHEIRKGISAIEKFGEETASEFLKDDRIIHVYGSATGGHDGFALAQRPRNPSMQTDAAAYMRMIDTAHAAAENILTIAPGKMREDDPVIKKARERIRAAR